MKKAVFAIWPLYCAVVMGADRVAPHVITQSSLHFVLGPLIAGLWVTSIFSFLNRRCRNAMATAMLFGLVSGIGSTRAETLQQVVDFALQNHPRIRVAVSTARSVRYEVDQAEAAKSPKFGVIADPGRSYSRTNHDWNSAGDLGVRGTYLLYDGKRTDNEIERQKARLNSASERSDITTEALVTQVTDAYIEVLKQERLEALATANVDAHTELHNKVREIVKLDKGRAYDLIQVGARLQQANVTLSSRHGALQEARAQLTELVGKALDQLQMPDDPNRLIPPTQQAALDVLEQHPAVKAAEAEIQVAQRAAAIAAAWGHPRVDLQGTLNSPHDFEGDRKYLSNYDVRFNVQWTPFDGGAGRSAAKAAAEQLNAAKENQASVRRDLANDVTRFWSQIETRRARGAAWLDLVNQTAKVRENYWLQFTIGRRSILDLLNAENETFQARSSAEQERLEVLQAQFRLLGSLAQIGKFLGLRQDASKTHGANTAPAGTVSNMTPIGREAIGVK